MLKKTALKAITLLLLPVMLTGLCACGGNQPFEAKDLLQTNLDIIYRGSYTAEALAQCGITAEEADQMYDNSINTEVSYFCKYFDIDRDLLSEETQSRMYDMYRQIYGKVQYTIGSETATENGYTVSLSIRPLLIFSDFLNEDADAVMNDWQQRMDMGELDTLTDTEREEAWADGIINAIATRAADSSADYAAPIEVTVAITADADGYLSISDDAMAEIDRLLIEY